MICFLLALQVRSELRPLVKLSGRTPVLTYHDVVAQRTASSLWFDCSSSELRQQLGWLKKQGAGFVSVDQLYSHLSGGPNLAAKSVVITFADNYEGFYRFGWPILRELKIPFALFVHTDFVGNRQGRPKMTWTQLRELQATGLATICSQTLTHPVDLRKLSDSELWRELTQSKKAIESEMRSRCDFLAYPNGVFDARCAKMASAAGYKLAFTERLTPAEKSPNLMMISRYVHTRYRQAWRDAH